MLEICHDDLMQSILVILYTHQFSIVPIAMRALLITFTILCTTWVLVSNS